MREYHWAVVQPTDETNRPQDGVLAGKIHLMLDGLLHEGLDEWMVNTHKTCSGEVLARSAEGQLARRIGFVDAYCVNEGLFFDGTSRQQGAAISVLLSARQLLIDRELTLENNWPGHEASASAK